MHVVTLGKAVGGSGVRYRRGGANALRKEFAILSRNLYIVHVNGSQMIELIHYWYQSLKMWGLWCGPPLFPQLLRLCLCRVDPKLRNEMCSRCLSKRRNKQCQTHKILQIHSETVFQCVLLAAGQWRSKSLRGPGSTVTWGPYPFPLPSFPPLSLPSLISLPLSFLSFPSPPLPFP